MGKSAGKAPDYKGAAEQQAQSSADAIGAQTQANRPNTSGPFGTESWTTGPDGTTQRTLGFAGGLGAGAAALGNEAGAALGQPLDPGLFGPIQDGSAARDSAINAEFGQAVSRLNPMFEQKENATRSRLANQGLDPNSQAARTEMGNFGRDRNDAYTSALNRAIGSGREAGDSAFRNNALQHQMAIADAMKRREAPLEQMSSLQRLLQNPGFHGAGAADATNYFGATAADGNWRMKDAEMQNQFWGELAGGVMGAAGSFAKLSDERLKQNIRRLPAEAIPGVPFATWEWKGQPGTRELGVIAQDLQKVAPHFVHAGADGFLRVDYSFLDAHQKEGTS